MMFELWQASPEEHIFTFVLLSVLIVITAILLLYEKHKKK